MKLAAIVSYSGERFYGFQRQRELRTVQSVLEETISRFYGKETLLKAAGRTDIGVHAKGQVISFIATPHFDLEGDRRAINRLLPEDVSLRRLVEVPDSFDARHSSVGKVYRYTFLINERDPLRCKKIAQLSRDDFDFDAFLQALRQFEGKHNFQNFTTKPEDKDGFIRTIQPIDVERGEEGNLVEVTLRSDGFMRYQIRLMMGAAIRVAIHRLKCSDIAHALEQAERSIVPYKAPAEGLCLMEVLYEEPLGL